MIKVRPEVSSERFRRVKNLLYRVDKPLICEGEEINSHFIVGEDRNWVFISIFDAKSKPIVAFHKSMIVG